MGNFSPRFFETNEEYIAPLFKPSLLGEMDDGEMFSLHFCSLFELHLDILYVKNKIII